VRLLARIGAKIGLGLALTCACAGASGCSSDVTIGTAPPPVGGPLEPAATHATAIEKVDLLFVVDNSSSMAAKQKALARRIPELLRQLTKRALDPSGGDAPRVTDLHVAVITTSLGSQGTSACAPGLRGPHMDDAAHLLPRDANGPTTGWTFDEARGAPAAIDCPTPRPGAPIRWVADAASGADAELKGADDLATLDAAVTCTVLSAGENGCDYEMPLEAMYRFLADPTPAKTIGATCAKNDRVPGDHCTDAITHAGIDTELLAQREAFLRPDSVLAIVMLTDENDASLRAEGTSWLPWAAAPGGMPRGTSNCASMPDDREGDASNFACTACDGEAATTDRACLVPWAKVPVDADVDGPNLRAFHQLQRYGRDFLYPTSRYVAALTAGTVRGWDGLTYPNPIFAHGRARDQVVLVGIVGVPPTLVDDAGGSPRALDETDWSRLVSPEPSLRDPHMIESIGPRAGLPLYDGNSEVDTVHGGERAVRDGDDLQYACLGATVPNGGEIVSDCADLLGGGAAGNPACLDGGMVRVRAYPSLRPLRVMHQVGLLGGGALVASICDDSYRGATLRIAQKIAAHCAASGNPPALR
jgi:hypothetical protein